MKKLSDVVILRHNKCEKYCEALIMPIMIFDSLLRKNFSVKE